MLDRRRFLAGAGLALGSTWGGQTLAQDGGRVERKALRPVFPTPTLPIRPDDAIQRLIRPLREKFKLPGLIAGVLEGDKLAAIGAVGIRKEGSEQPMEVSDVVHLGSCTKAMTATLCGMIVEEGKLRWTSRIEEVFPDLAKPLAPDYRKVTLEQLLTHRAGLPANGPWHGLGSDRSPTEQRRVLLSRIMKSPPEHAPGTHYEYSNVGYALAGLMAEQVSGQSWEQLLTERLFVPLGMSTAGFGPPGKPGTVDQPWGHVEQEGHLKPSQLDNARSLGPAGTVHCSVPDWTRFAALHLRAAEGRPLLLSAETFKKLHTPPPGGDYACGWTVVDRPWAGGRAFNHQGSNTFWHVNLWLAPRRDFATLVATNLGGARAAEATDAVTGTLIQRQSSRIRPRRAGG